MAKGVNKWIGIGNLGRDPEVRYTQGGMAIAKMSIACNERKKEGDKWVDHTEWVNVTCFGKTAENVGQHLRKGRQVYVEGKLRTSSWEKDGEKKWKTEVVASEITFLGGGDGSGQGGGGGGGARREVSDKDRQEPADSQDGFFDDDLPF